MSRLGKYVRWVGIAGGLGAAIWAMRDRFVAIAVPREPERPVFRTPPTNLKRDVGENLADTPPSESDDLTQINGIGPVFAERLAVVGIRNFVDLARRTDTELAALLEIADTRVTNWQGQAQARLEN